MITDWVVYRDGLPDFPTRSDARTANALLTLLQLADPEHVRDVYPQKCGNGSTIDPKQGRTRTSNDLTGYPRRAYSRGV